MAPEMITDIEDFFTRGCGRCERFDSADCSAIHWQHGLGELRRICRGASLIEQVKWGHPCYMHAGRNIALVGAVRGDFRLIFFNAALMKDPDGLLERQGPNTRHPDMIRFEDGSEVVRRAASIQAYLHEAMAYAEAGLKAPRGEGAIDLPDELVDALDADPELAEAFRKLTPGRQRSYAINLYSARKPETRIARIAGFRPKILAGKGALDR